MATVTLPAHGWTPRDYQLPAWHAIRDPGITTIILAWARRHGKDDIAMHATAVKAMERVGNYYHALPLYSQARKDIWEAVNPRTGRKRWKDAFPSEIIKHVDNQSMMLTLVNGSTWQLVGTDNIDSLMGSVPVGVVLSEAALSNPTAYAMLRPILLENNGWSMHISSTRGKNHFYEMFQAYQGQPHAFTSHISARDTDVFTDAQLAEELRVYVRLYGEALGRSYFEQEYLSNWDAATVGAVWGEELAEMEQEGRIQPLRYDRRFPVETSWDLGVGDPTVILFWQDIAGQPRLIDWYQSSDAGLDHFAQVLQQRGYLYGTHYWPHDGASREFGSGISRKSQAKQLGLDVKVMPNIPKQDSLALASQLLRRAIVNADTENPPDNRADDVGVALESLKQYRFKFNQTTRTLSANPIHDEHSHIADALQTYAIAKAGAEQVPLPAQAPEQFDTTRLRDIMRPKQVKGAFG